MAGLDPDIHIFTTCFFRKRWITGSSPVTTISIGLKIIARSDLSAVAQRAKAEATLRELAAAFDYEPKHPAYFGLGFRHPRFQRRKVRCVAGPRHHPQEILARCFRSESLGDAEPQDLREVMIKSCRRTQDLRFRLRQDAEPRGVVEHVQRGDVVNIRLVGGVDQLEILGTEIDLDHAPLSIFY